MAVDVPFAVGVDQEFVFGGDNNNWLKSVPEFMLGERMPDVSAIPFDKPVFVVVG